MANGTETCRKVVIVVRGNEEGDLDSGFDEAVRKIRDGNTSGADRNDTGGYYFDVIEDIPESEWPSS